MNDFNLAGQRFGKLAVVSATACIRMGKLTYWNCRCECDKTVVVTYGRLIRGEVYACPGCTPPRAKPKGYSKHPLYRVWVGMHQRCRDPHFKAYKHYGGRGIRVCDKWSGPDGFENFLNDMDARPAGTEPSGKSAWSLDRINVNGNYEPDNCRWANRATQAANKRKTHEVQKDLDEWRDRAKRAETELKRRNTASQAHYLSSGSIIGTDSYDPRRATS